MTHLLSNLLPQWFTDYNLVWYFADKISYDELLMASDWLINNLMKTVHVTGSA